MACWTPCIATRRRYAVSPLRVVLVSPRNPLNIGAAARAMSNFGFSELRLVNPYEVAFREARSAVKAQHVLEQAREYPTVAEAVADCALVVGTTSMGHRALEHPLRRLEMGGKLIAKKLATAPVALLFGSEKFGLSNEDMSHCHWLMRIPDARGARLDEPGPGGGRVPLRDHPQPRRRAKPRPTPKRPADGGTTWSASRSCSKKCWIAPATSTRASKDPRA